MKNFIYLIVALIFFAGCDTTTDTTDSPEVVQKVVEDYLAAIGDRNWESLNAISTDNMLIFETGMIWNNDSMEMAVEGAWEGFEIKYELEFIETKVGTDVAWILYKNHGVASKDEKSKEMYWLETAVLEKVEGEWKIAGLHSTKDKTVVPDKPDITKHEVPVMTHKHKHKRAVSLFYSSEIASIHLAKKSGKSLDKHIQQLGDLYKQGWNADKGYDLFVYGVLLNFENFRFAEDPPIEIVEKTDSSMTFKWFVNYKSEFENGNYMGVSKEDFDKWMAGVFAVIAEHMGCTVDFAYEGDWLTVGLGAGF